MAQRPIWRGHLRLALVSCPVALYSARHDREAIRFNFINPETCNRIRMISQDAETGAEVRRADLVRGYEFRKDHYLILTEEDFEAARVESSTTIKVEKFVPHGSINPLFFDTPYYLVPDGDAAQDVYLVLQEAIRRTGRLALSRVVISRRERAIAIMPMDGGLAAHTLSEFRDINDASPLMENVPKGQPDPAMVDLAIQLIDRQTGELRPADLVDRFEARLREVIAAKLKGEGFAAEPEPDRSNVIDIMAALKRSLAAPDAGEPKAGAARKTKAKAPAPAASSGKKEAKPPPPKPGRQRA